MWSMGWGMRTSSMGRWRTSSRGRGRTSSRGRGRPKGKGRESMEREVPSVLLLLCKNEAILPQLEDGYREQ